MPFVTLWDWTKLGLVLMTIMIVGVFLDRDLKKNDCPIADPADFTCEDMVKAFRGIGPPAYYASQDSIVVPVNVKDKCLMLTAPFLNKHADCVEQEKARAYTDNSTSLVWSLTASDVNYFFNEIHVRYKCPNTVPHTAVNDEMALNIIPTNIVDAIKCMKGRH